MKYYILNKDKSISPTNDIMEWAGFMDNKENSLIVRKSFLGDCEISTVFLGIDHNWFGGEPHLFETMVFPDCEIMERTRTYEEAVKKHEEICRELEHND